MRQVQSFSHSVKQLLAAAGFTVAMVGTLSLGLGLGTYALTYLSHPVVSVLDKNSGVEAIEDQASDTLGV